MRKQSNIKILSNIIEIVLVLVVGFGLFIYSSSISISKPSKIYNSTDAYFIVMYEIVALSIIRIYLKKRRWPFRDFHLEFNYKMVGAAIILVLARNITGWVITKILKMLNIIDSTFQATIIVSYNINLIGIILLIIINSIYEEVLLTGYLFKKFDKLHPILLILINFILRTSYHTYQGWENLPMVFSLSLIFGIYYIKYKNLWTIIWAHGIGNMVSFF